MPSSRSRLGTRGEEIARQYLESKGYQIVTTNFRCPHGEVDIIARAGPCLAFIEVRTRRSPGSFGTPEESLSKAKRERLVATAETYLQAYPDSTEDWRIDLIGVHLTHSGAIERVDHVEHAVQLD